MHRKNGLTLVPKQLERTVVNLARNNYSSLAKIRSRRKLMHSKKPRIFRIADDWDAVLKINGFLSRK